MKARLNEIFNLQMGKTPSRNISDYWDNGTHDWVSIADLSNYQKYVGETKEKITDLAIRESGIKRVPANTVIMSFKLSLGKTAITKYPIYTNEAIMAFLPSEQYDVLPEYIYYLFTVIDWTKGTNRAVMGATLNKTTLGEVTIDIPTLEEQRKISAMLDRVNDFIQKRQLQLNKLEELIEARFIEMFGNPEYNENSHPVYKLKDLFDIGSSKRIYQREQTNSGVPFLRVADLTELIQTGQVGSSLYISDVKYEELRANGQTPKSGDILVTSRGTIGCCYIIKPGDKFYFQDGMISWLYNTSDLVNVVYIYYLFQMDGFKHQFLSKASGSTVSYLSIAQLKELDVILPPLSLQQKFADFVSRVDQSKQTIQQSLQKLETLKNAMMQQYFG